MNALCSGPWQEQVVIEEVKMDLKGMEQVRDPITQCVGEIQRRRDFHNLLMLYIPSSDFWSRVLCFCFYFEIVEPKL